MNKVAQTVRELPNRQRINWSQDNTDHLEDELAERAADRAKGAIK